MWYELYTQEKLRELEEESARRRHHLLEPKPLLAPVLRWAGGALRRLGEALESWGATRPESATDGELA